jgi:hypothetical protein
LKSSNDHVSSSTQLEPEDISIIFFDVLEVVLVAIAFQIKIDGIARLSYILDATGI